MKNIRDLEKDIQAGKNVDENLPMYMNECASQNYRHAGMELAMQYYDLYEGIADGHIKNCEGSEETVAELNAIIKAALLESFDAQIREKAIEKTDMLREGIIKKMQVLTAYTDRFALYEYILNRAEFRFSEEDLTTDDLAEAAKMTEYIFGVKDNVTVNTRIKEIVGQLPVRITKEKFYELVRTGLSIYEGTQTESVEDFIYMIKSVSGLYIPDGMDEMFLNLKEIYEQLKSYNYKEITYEDYLKLTEVLKDAVDAITTATECYYLVTGVVNSLYAVLLNMPYASVQASAFIDKIMPVVRCANEKFEKHDWSGIPGDVAACFSETEGELEKSIENIQRGQAALEVITASHKDKLQSMMLEKLYECLMASSKLLSNSSFAALYKEQQDIIADKEYVEKKTEELVNDFMAVFKGQSQVLNRAMMAAVLSELPVFFSTHNEVSEYIRNSLFGCHDMAEKKACVNIISTIISDN